MNQAFIIGGVIAAAVLSMGTTESRKSSPKAVPSGSTSSMQVAQPSPSPQASPSASPSPVGPGILRR